MKKKHITIFVLLVLLAVKHMLNSAPLSTQGVTVRSVIDGDTITVDLVDGTTEKVRILGINTPEVYPQVECGGPEATARMRELLPVGTNVELLTQPGVQRDKYDRLLRYVHQSKVDIGLQLLAEGMARRYTKAEHPRQNNYKAVERQAISKNLGVWSCAH